ncbi:hypothetical protein A2U01_0090092, partial [Trifolium medium]|nr:hypothetical protein [Trifolium medium]
QNLNTGADGGCEVEPDAAHAVMMVVVVVLLLLLGLPVTPSLPSENTCDLGVAQRWISHKCPPQ